MDGYFFIWFAYTHIVWKQNSWTVWLAVAGWLAGWLPCAHVSQPSILLKVLCLKVFFSKVFWFHVLCMWQLVTELSIINIRSLGDIKKKETCVGWLAVCLCLIRSIRTTWGMDCWLGWAGLWLWLWLAGWLAGWLAWRRGLWLPGWLWLLGRWVGEPFNCNASFSLNLPKMFHVFHYFSRINTENTLNPNTECLKIKISCINFKTMSVQLQHDISYF